MIKFTYVRTYVRWYSVCVMLFCDNIAFSIHNNKYLISPYFGYNFYPEKREEMEFNHLIYELRMSCVCASAVA